MDLHLKRDFVKLDFLHWGVVCIALHDNQVLIKAPRLAIQDFVYFLQVIKYKQNYIVTLVLDAKSTIRAPQLFESSCHCFHLKKARCKELSCNNKLTLLVIFKKGVPCVLLF